MNTPQQIQLLDDFAGSTVYIGGQPAPWLDGGTTISIPASSIVGPADEECIGADGDTFAAQAAVSYGVQPLALSANLLPPTGDPTVYLFGYGFSASPGETPSVTVGGSPVEVTSLSYGGPTLQGEAIQVPNGTPGESANVVVSSSVGSGTLTAAATYYPAPTILPASGLLQLLYDTHRNLLYALKATEVDVLNPATLQWQSPILLPQPATPVSYAIMALSPDGSWLVAGSSDSHIVVLNPDQPSQAQLLTSSLTSSLSSLTITEFDKVILAGPQVVELDLSSLTFTALHILMGALVKSSADGTHVYAVNLSYNFEVYSMDPSTYVVQTVNFYPDACWTDIAVLPNGSQFAAICAPPYAAGDYVGFYNSSPQYINANVYPDFSPPDDTGVIGATFSPAGKVLVVPLGDSIEFWNAAQGTLLARLMTPEELQVWAYPEVAVSPLMALDPSGQTIYAVSASGLTILTLPESLDQMPAVHWPSIATGGARSRFQGFFASRKSDMHSKRKK